jgi:hypothetical protein
MSDMYILEGKTPVKVDTLKEWARGHMTCDWRIARDNLGDYLISTVFLGLDHGHSEGPPVLFETMVFDGRGRELDGYTRRYSTWEEAEDGHKAVVSQINAISGDSS